VSPPGAGRDRRGLAALAGGHFVIDSTVGAVPALLPVWTAALALSDLEAAMVLAASLLVSSATQPLFGWMADRRATPAFLWGGVAVAAAGFAAAGLAAGYPVLLALIVASGLGVAAFHPEAARVANRIAGRNRATGLAWFMVGGNAGFAAGPLLVAIVLPALDARATIVFLVPGLLVVTWLVAARGRLAIEATRPERGGLAAASHTPGLILLLVVTSLRTWAQFGLLALAPLYLVDERDFSDEAAAIAVFVFSAAGALATVVGAWGADRVGGRVALAVSLPLATPAIAAFLLLDGPGSVLALGLAGFALMASFSVTVAMGQEYLPHRLALAAGLMIGFGAIGSAPPGLALFGALADAAGRGTAIAVLAAVPVIAGARARAPPAPRGEAPV
jgi:FSR family fosmidomycin resistance protein-like MFS transporter